jgi:hypothetical protein
MFLFFTYFQKVDPPSLTPNHAGKNHGFGSILGLVYVGMCLAVSPLDYADSAVFPTALTVLQNTSYLSRCLLSFFFYPSVLFLLITLLVIATTSAPMNT